jgi:hypothetical protein
MVFHRQHHDALLFHELTKFGNHLDYVTAWLSLYEYNMDWRNTYNILAKNLKGRYSFGDLDIDEKIILKGS